MWKGIVRGRSDNLYDIDLYIMDGDSWAKRGKASLVIRYDVEFSPKNGDEIICIDGEINDRE